MCVCVCVCVCVLREKGVGGRNEMASVEMAGPSINCTHLIHILTVTHTHTHTHTHTPPTEPHDGEHAPV